MPNDILDPSALISLLPSLLPTSSKKLQSSQDGLAALVHSVLSAVGFRLTAVGDMQVTASESINVLSAGWNKSGPDHYNFKYKHDQSSLEFVVKIGKLGGRTLVNAIAVESDKVASLDIATNDFTSSSFFPHDLGAEDAAPLVHGFISSNRVTDFVSQLKLVVIQKLVPGLRKEGYQEETSEAASNSSGQPVAPVQQPPPARPQAQQPPLPPIDDPLRDLRIPSRNPLEIGRRDLDPFPQNPFNPPSLFPHGDGMFVGPDHPIFGDRRGPAPRGPWGGDGFLPPMGAPPGARFDPIGPGPVFPPRGGRGLGGPGRGGNARFGGDPDNDEFMPPGSGDMYM
ncbi:hypothetical protein BDN72DRAFT_786314 [Pluteus cervinus]|uniref:Uncharacterized protein n=1 Tax=Pluteus cervinus TaxID=181527 RepID=A0ACD3BD79_9AGAR|nr:hypothetical protein BDN72DRAFT_786314 [Pluteus cervinus]